MGDKETTQKKLEIAAMAEFLEKGFMNASLRNIVKEAGVTTGAFYRYYASKEDLFYKLIGIHAEYVVRLYNGTIDDFEQLPGETQTEQMTDVSMDCIWRMMDYIYEHFDAFKVLMTGADGTPYADFLHKIVEREVASTYAYIQTLTGMNHEVPPINSNLIHMIAIGEFNGFFEVVVRDMPKEEALVYVKQFREFYEAGWERLMHISFGGQERS